MTISLNWYLMIGQLHQQFLLTLCPFSCSLDFFFGCVWISFELIRFSLLRGWLNVFDWFAWAFVSRCVVMRCLKPAFISSTVEQFDYGTLDLSRGRRSIAITTFFYHFSYFTSFSMSGRIELFFSLHWRKSQFLFWEFKLRPRWSMLLSLSQVHSRSHHRAHPSRRDQTAEQLMIITCEIMKMKFHHISCALQQRLNMNHIPKYIEYAWKKSRAPIPFVTYFFSLFFCNNNLFPSQTKPRS